MNLRLFKDVTFTFVVRKTLQICYDPKFGYIEENQMHETTYNEIRK